MAFMCLIGVHILKNVPKSLRTPLPPIIDNSIAYLVYKNFPRDDPLQKKKIPFIISMYSTIPKDKIDKHIISFTSFFFFSPHHICCTISSWAC